MSESTITLTAENFDEVVGKSELPILVDFWAEWCGPCKMIAPILEEIATENSGKILIGKLNIDEHPSLQARFGIQSIPTMIVFKGGEPAKPPIVGALPKSRLVDELSSFLA